MDDGSNVYDHQKLIKDTFDGLCAGTYVEAAKADPDCPFSGADPDSPTFRSAQASAAEIACSNARQPASKDPSVAFNITHHPTEQTAWQASGLAWGKLRMTVNFSPGRDNTEKFELASRKLFGVNDDGTGLEELTPMIGEEGRFVGAKGWTVVSTQTAGDDALYSEADQSRTPTFSLPLR